VQCFYERPRRASPLPCQVCVTAKPFSMATMLTEKRGRSPMSGRGIGLRLGFSGFGFPGLGFPGLGFWGLGFLAFALASAAAAQGNLDQGKSGAQLYASACATCHKSPPSLSNTSLSNGRWLFGLESFLREHYTSSRESAAILATYLKGQEKALADSQRGRLGRQTAQTRRDQPGTSGFGDDIPRPPADIPDVKR
jgi:cytochrome c553